MGKSWFEIGHWEYHCPDLPQKVGNVKGRMSLGSVIANMNTLRGRDSAINMSDEGINFTPDVSICHTPWEELKDYLNITAPIGGAVSVLAAPQTKPACEQWGTLDRYTFEPNREFIQKILEDEKVAAHIEQTKGIKRLEFGDQWSVYMVTGITVARRPTVRVFVPFETEPMFPKAEFDLVCALKLTKIWKSAMGSDWKFKTETRGANCL